MSKKMLINLVLALAMLLTLGVSAASGAPAAQEAMTYTVKLGDNLWTLAKKYLGSGPAWWAIAGSTSVKHEEDISFALIDNPDLIHPGWKFLIPSVDEQGNISLPDEVHGHDAECASYCARAVLKVKNDDGDWVALDANGDGRIQSCIIESRFVPANNGESCLTAVHADGRAKCPEVPDEARCARTLDNMPILCELQYGPDRH